MGSGVRVSDLELFLYGSPLNTCKYRLHIGAVSIFRAIAVKVCLCRRRVLWKLAFVPPNCDETVAATGKPSGGAGTTTTRVEPSQSWLKSWLKGRSSALAFVREGRSFLSSHSKAFEHSWNQLVLA